MFQKVLINDDHDAIIENVADILAKNNTVSVQKSQHCDEAFLKIKKGKLDNDCYDLLITDLSFKRDHRVTNLESGEALIERVRQEFPKLPIIVYSMKDQLQKVRSLLKKYHINGYVCKDRNGSKELEQAVNAVSNGDLYLSPQVKKALSPKTQLEIDDFDVQLLQLMSMGLSQDDISATLKLKDVFPNSLSTIEKRLNKLKSQFKANNSIHLVAITKDLGVI